MTGELRDVEQSPGNAGAAFVAVDGLYPDTPYAYAGIAPPGRLVFSAGACPLDASGRVVAPGDLEAQVRLTVSNLVATLEAAGAGLGDVLKTTVYVAAGDRADLVTAWQAYELAIAPHRPPSTLLGVAMLGYPDQLVEVEAVAVAR